MSETERRRPETDEIESEIARLRAELAQISTEEIEPLSERLQETFDVLGRSVAQSFAEATAAGKLSIRRIVEDVTRDVARIAADNFIRQPVESAILGIFGGFRADGGAVARNLPYVVGERGPELFVPRSAGRIDARAQRPVTINVNLPQTDQAGPRRSRAQMARELGGLVRRMSRNA